MMKKYKKHLPILALYFVLLTPVALMAAWTTPRSWTTNELVTASMLDIHLRDNLNFLYDARVPTGMVMFSTTGSCPTGWTEYTTARGRYIVGLPASGTNAATVGTALSNTENRAAGQHTHDFQTYSSGGTGAISVQNSTRDATPQTVNTGGVQNGGSSVAGTNAPYVQLMACEKS